MFDIPCSFVDFPQFSGVAWCLMFCWFHVHLFNYVQSKNTDSFDGRYNSTFLIAPIPLPFCCLGCSFFAVASRAYACTLMWTCSINMINHMWFIELSKLHQSATVLAIILPIRMSCLNCHARMHDFSHRHIYKPKFHILAIDVFD